MLTEHEKEKLRNESAQGVKSAAIWRDFIEPFYVAKTAVLFNAFRDCPIRDAEGLMNIKLQCTALDSLKSELTTFIETGKMADLTLKQDAEKHKKQESNT